jgi:hypothetical protein
MTKDREDRKIFPITSVTDDDITWQIADSVIDLSEAWFCFH